MSATRELTVPDIGDFTDVPVIEVFVKPGDVIGKDAPVVTLESEKSTLDVPADFPGKVTELRVKVGDRVSRGTVLAIIQATEPAAVGANAGAPVSAQPAAPASAPAASGGVRDIVVPDIGDFKDIPVIEVFVKQGDAVTKDTPILTLESEKSTLDIPASFAGTIKELRVKVGDRVSAGTVVATASTSEPAAASAAPAAAPPAAAASAPAPDNGASRGLVSSIHPPAGIRAQAVSSNGTSNGAASGPVHASPSIRRFARELGVELAQVRGSGPNGRITREDVQGWVKQALSSVSPAGLNGGSAGAGGGLQVLPWPKVDFASFGPVERVPLTRIKKLSGPNLHRNWVTIPHVTQHDEADITDLETMRKSINAEQQEAKVTMLAFMIIACVACLKRYPDVNSSLEGDELIQKRYYNIGFAADTPGGLVVPVIRDADRKGVLDIAKETATLAKKARDGKLTGAEMQGGTFTISSLGGIGGTAFTPIINAPEVAILGVSKAALKPVWDGKTFVPRLMVPLSLSYDHRVIDGASAARFCATLAQTLADLRRALL